MAITSDFYMSEGSSPSRWGGNDSDNESELEEPSSKDNRMEIIEGHGSMNPAIYKAAITGNVDDFRAMTVLWNPDSVVANSISSLKTPQAIFQSILLRVLGINDQSTIQTLISNAIEKDVKDGLKAANKEGNTPLHLALKNRHKKVAKLLFDKNKEASCCLNKEDKSPLYMAVEVGYLNLVTVMIT
ncbi:hypothetical protein F0562_011458 [Nyssa sinensis]|uniref:Uncharacterized protein n=1 Tax=Nyssa sinensis TaxID=561372 RepID=A0A5J5A541_9ASTE|nr:hypothetical protein F0562_011458 [Nyssa sinensis]